jgi:hypothetical protein
MESFITKPNVFCSVYEKTKNKMSMEDIISLSNSIYDYAIECKNGMPFNEQESRLIIERYTPPDHTLRKELWATMCVFCFENYDFKLVNKYNTGNPYEALNECMGAAYHCGLLYDEDQNTRYNTYFTWAGKNEIQRTNRTASSNGVETPGKWAYITAFIGSNPELSDEEVAEQLEIPIKRVKICRNAMRARCVVSMDEQFDGDNNSGDGSTLAAVLDSGEDVAAEFCERESEKSIMTEFLPIIAKIYGEDSAYVSLLRTGILWSYKRISFYKMEALYCIYLVTKKKLENLAEELPNYKDLCAHVKYLFATGGRNQVEEYIKGKPEEYLIHNLLDKAEKEAHNICSSENKSASDCFKPAGSLNYMFTKIFPVKPGALSEQDKRQAARFRKELRDSGLDQVANALFTAMKNAPSE